MRIENPEPEMLTQAAIIKRGWSKAMIEKLLGAPDGSGRNPFYRSAPPVRLYLLSRVEGAEGTAEFAELMRKRQARGKAGEAVADRKRAELLAEIEQYEITLPELSLESLAYQAARNYESLPRTQESYDGGRAFEPWNVPDAFRDRCCVNYLRHCCTEYEEHLERLTRRVGKGDAYLLLNRRIGQLITAKYPVLKQEVQAQLQKKHDGD